MPMEVLSKDVGKSLDTYLWPYKDECIVWFVLVARAFKAVSCYEEKSLWSAIIHFLI